jgi:regulatory protein YycI of two-component signal transduction system YycFG
MSPVGLTVNAQQNAPTFINNDKHSESLVQDAHHDNIDRPPTREELRNAIKAINCSSSLMESSIIGGAEFKIGDINYYASTSALFKIVDGKEIPNKEVQLIIVGRDEKTEPTSYSTANVLFENGQLKLSRLDAQSSVLEGLSEVLDNRDTFKLPPIKDQTRP